MQSSIGNKVPRALHLVHRHLLSQRRDCKLCFLFPKYVRSSEVKRVMKRHEAPNHIRIKIMISVDIPDLSTAMKTAPCKHPVEGSVNRSRMRSRESMLKMGL